jgi:hypothetical protein
MLEQLELSPEYWRKCTGEARTIAEMITDDFTRDTMFGIARQYDELAERAERRQRRHDYSMARWFVDFAGKVLSTLGSVEAPDEKSAIEQAAKDFRIPPARRDFIRVTQVSERHK